MKSYKVIGLMSGSSLDGLDLAACEFQHNENTWNYRIDYSDTYRYDPVLRNKLKTSINLDRQSLNALDREYGKWLGEQVVHFCSSHNYRPDLISSHGHTVFHQPESGITLQIGDGTYLSEITGLPVVNDFRTQDVAKGGQGAPLVPVGDELLFPMYDFCLNLGGIANVSTREKGVRTAYDICPANMALNHLSSELDLLFDEDGRTARKGVPVNDLLINLDTLAYYIKPYPKSLGVEWFNEQFRPLLDTGSYSVPDLLSTVTHHIVQQIVNHLERNEAYSKSGTLLLTGGGTFNTFLLELLEQKCDLRLIIPDEQLISYKEALIFGLLGVLKVRNEVNCFSSVTGASSDTSTGTLHGHIE